MTVLYFGNAHREVLRINITYSKTYNLNEIHQRTQFTTNPQTSNNTSILRAITPKAA